jgi:hypothetical protein
MPVSISWDDEAKTTIRWDYIGKWTWHDVAGAYEEVRALMNSVPYPVCLIHDLRQSAGIPGGALTQAYRYTMALPDNWDISVVVGSGTFIEALLSVFVRLYSRLGARYHAAPTLEEARALIARHRGK